MLAGRRRAALIDCLTTGCHPPGTVVRLDVAPEALATRWARGSADGTVLDERGRVGA